MSDSEISEVDYQSEDGELKPRRSSPEKNKHNEELPFSLSDEDDTADSLDIKPPQATVHSYKSRSHREKRSHRDKDKRAYGHLGHSGRNEEQRVHRKSHHRSREERHREHREERQREREKRHHRDKHSVSLEPRRERVDQGGLDERKHRDDTSSRGHREDAHGISRMFISDSRGLSYRDVLEGRSRDSREVRESRDLRDYREKGDRKEELSRDRSHKNLGDRALDDLRERILDRRRDGESHRERNRERERHKRDKRELQLQQLEAHHQQLELQQRQQEAEQEIVVLPSPKETPQERVDREERENRRLKLLETDREMVRQKEVYRRELEARRARRQVEEEKERTLENIAKKRKRSRSIERRRLEKDVTEIIVGDSDVEMIEDDVEADKDDSTKAATSGSCKSSNVSDMSSSSPSESGNSETDSDQRASDVEEESVRQKNNGTEGEDDERGQERDSPGNHTDTGDEQEHIEENGRPSTPPKSPQIKTKADGLDELPPYLPAVNGCRSVEEFQCLNRIDEGTYGIVYRAKDKRTHEIVALKRLKMEKEREGFPITSLREINTLLKAQHRNIVTVREIVVGSNMDKIFIVMDYVAHDLKSLMETMRHKRQVFLPGEVKCLMQQLLSAVSHLHDNWILHRDLKTSNLLLSHEGVLKVGDFGMAREYGSPLKAYTSVVVTLWYRSPELLLCTQEYSTPVDVWSVGCIFAEFLLMEALFPGKSEVDQLNRIFKELGTPNEKIWPGYSKLPAVQKCSFTEYPLSNLRSRFATMLSEQGLDLMNKFLTYDPLQRITAEDALSHTYFKEMPLPIDPAMFPTWPAKSELSHRKAASPKAPSPGKDYKQLGNKEGEVAAMGFHMGAMERNRLAVGAGFSLKF